MRGGNHHVVIGENLSFEEEKPYEEEVVAHGNQKYNHDYQVKADISLFYRTMRVREFLG